MTNFFTIGVIGTFYADLRSSDPKFLLAFCGFTVNALLKITGNCFALDMIVLLFKITLNACSFIDANQIEKKIMKTFIPTEKDIARKTYLIDADGKTLGRMSTKIASLLIGKHKTCFQPDKLTGDQVVVINATKVHVTGNKKED